MKNMNKYRILFVILIMALAIGIIIKKPLTLGLDLQGGIQLILEAQSSDSTPVNQDSVSGVMEVIRNRVDGLGLSEPIITQKGEKQIIVELAGLKDPTRAMSMVGETALLEFVEAEWAYGDISKFTPDKIKILAGPDARLGVYEEKDNQGNIIKEAPIFLKKTVLTGADLSLVTAGYRQDGEPTVSIEFTKKGSDIFKDVTTRHVGRPLAILLDGKIISAPKINEPIAGGQAQISGQFSTQEMRDLVIKLKAGSLPVPVEIVSNRIVGATLGHDSIEASKRAALIGFALVCIYMVLIYRLPGFLSSITLGAYVLLSIALLKLFGATLTLPGIAGFILTMGMAVDANVIIFERIKEEYTGNTSLIKALHLGFDRAFTTIMDSNITTLVAAFVLFWLGTGSIKGFAVTLSIGILVSMYSSIILTKLILLAFSPIFEKNKNLFFKVTQ